VFDVVIVGTGTAGLSAALVLGRARRRVLLVGEGPPRNAPAEAAHGFFTRDGTPPAELLRIGREQLAPYGTVAVREARAVSAERGEGRFVVGLADGGSVAARRLLLATGVEDLLPSIPGFRDLWGQGVYHCPYCHGWEARDLPLAVYARGEVAMHLAPLVRQWSRDLVLLTDGPAELDGDARRRLAALEIPIREEPIARLDGGAAGLAGVVFAGGEALPRRGLFLRPRQRPRTELAEQIGCALSDDERVPGLIQVDAMGETTVPGVFAAGDVVTPMQQVATAAAGGAAAAAMLNHGLVAEEVAAA